MTTGPVRIQQGMGTPLAGRPYMPPQGGPAPQGPVSMPQQADPGLLRTKGFDPVNFSQNIFDPGGFTKGNSLKQALDPINFTKNLLDPGGWFGGGPEKLRGKIDEQAGTVNVKGHGQKWDDAFTNYLRTGQGEPTGGRGAFRGLKNKIEALRNSGWAFGGQPAAPPASGPPGMQPVNPGGPGQPIQPQFAPPPQGAPPQGGPWLGSPPPGITTMGPQQATQQPRFGQPGVPPPPLSQALRRFGS